MQRHTGNLPVITLTKSLRNTRCALLSYPPSCSFSTPLPPLPFCPDPAVCCIRAYCSRPRLPPPSSNNQTPTTLFQPYEDPDHDLGDESELPSCSSPSENPSWSNLTMHLTVIQVSEARRPRRLFNSLMRRAHPIAYSWHLCLTWQSQQNCSTSALIKTCANLPTCPILLG